MSCERDELRDQVYWAMTLLCSALGTCDRLLVASSAENNKRLVGVGYNGSLAGQPHCDEAGHYMLGGHCERTRHSEMNLKDNTDQEKLRGALIRILGTPCLKCLKDLAGVPVAAVKFTTPYDNQNLQPRTEAVAEIFGSDFKLTQQDIDWVELFQRLFDLLAGAGGTFRRLGYRIKLVKEPLESEPNSTEDSAYGAE